MDISFNLYLTGFTYHLDMHPYLKNYIPNKVTEDARLTYHPLVGFQVNNEVNRTQTVVLCMKDTFYNPAGALLHGVFEPIRYGKIGLVGGIYARKPFKTIINSGNGQITTITIKDFPIQAQINNDLEIIPIILGTYSYQFDNNIHISIGSAVYLTTFLVGFTF